MKETIGPTWCNGVARGTPGKKIHAAIAHRIRTGQIRDDEWARYVEGVEWILRRLLSSQARAEVPYLLATELGPTWKGVIDVYDLVDPLTANVIEWKTTTSRTRFEHFKQLAMDEGPATLLTDPDPQLNSYAEWAFQRGGLSESGLVYVNRVFIDLKSAESDYTGWSLDRNVVREQWLKLQRFLLPKIEMDDRERAQAERAFAQLAAVCAAEDRRCPAWLKLREHARRKGKARA